MVVVIEHIGEGMERAAKEAIMESMRGLGIPLPELPPTMEDAPEGEIFCSLSEGIFEQGTELRRKVEVPGLSNRMNEAMASQRPGDTEALREACEVGLEASRAYLTQLVDEGAIDAPEAFDIMDETRQAVATELFENVCGEEF